MDAPAPWQLRGRAFVAALALPASLRHQQGGAAPELGEPVRGPALVMLVDYRRSEVGPYQELLFMPGPFRFPDGRLRWSIGRIYVSIGPVHTPCIAPAGCHFGSPARRRECRLVSPNKRPTTTLEAKRTPALRVAAINPPLCVTRRSFGATKLLSSCLDGWIYSRNRHDARSVNRPWDSADNGNRNWGLDKRVARFDWQRRGRRERVAVHYRDREIAALTLDRLGPALPFPGGLLPAGWRTLGQIRDGQRFLYTPSVRGRLGLARLREARGDGEHFPTLQAGRSRGALALPDFHMHFPVARTEPPR